MKKIAISLLMLFSLNAMAAKNECPQAKAPQLLKDYPKMIAPGVVAFKYDMKGFNTPTNIPKDAQYASFIKVSYNLSNGEPNEFFYYDVPTDQKNAEYTIDLNNNHINMLNWKASGVVMNLNKGGVCNESQGRDYIVRY